MSKTNEHKSAKSKSNKREIGKTKVWPNESTNKVKHDKKPTG